MGLKLGKERVHQFRRSWDLRPDPLDKNSEFHPLNINTYKNMSIKEIPAEILNASEFCKSAFPKKDADAPKITNTVENPKQNKINGKKLIFF